MSDSPQLVALFDTIRVGGGSIVSVKPKAAVMPPCGHPSHTSKGKDWRSRPGLKPAVFGLGIEVEGLDALSGLFAHQSA